CPFCARPLGARPSGKWPLGVRPFVALAFGLRPPGSARASGGDLEPLHLDLGEPPRGAARQSAEHEWSVAVTMKALHLEADGLADASHLVEASLVDPHVEGGPGRMRLDESHVRRRASLPGAERDTVSEPRDLIRTGHPVDAHAITFLHSVARVHEV